MRSTLSRALLAAALIVSLPSGLRAENRLSPPAPSGGRVPVSLGFFITNLVGVEEVAETFAIRGYLHMSWKDPRLAYRSRGASDASRVADPSKMWIPAVIVANAVHGRTTISTNVRVRPDGTVDYWEDMRDELTMQLVFHEFPFDRQSLPIIFQPFLDERDTMSLSPELEQTGINDQAWALLAQWEVLGVTAGERMARLGKGGQLVVPELDFQLGLRRRYAFYVWKVFLPLVVMALIAYCALWIKDIDHAPQLSVAMSALLTQIAFLFVIASSLPKVPYLTYIDAFFLISFLFAFGVLVELLFLHQAIVAGGLKRAARIRRWSRALYPVLYLAGNAAAAWAFFGR